jgi:hypothetical protein
MVTTIKVYYQTYDITWESLNVWIWTGIESHMAIVCASLPAMNHFFKNVLKDSVMSTGFKTWSNKNSGSGSGTRSKGYDQTTSQTDNSQTYDATRTIETQKGIHVVQDVKLEEFLDDERYDLYKEENDDRNRQWARGTNFIDEETLSPPKTSNTWLEDDTSSGDDAHPQRQESSRKYSGFADTRRFY